MRAYDYLLPFHVHPLRCSLQLITFYPGSRSALPNNPHTSSFLLFTLTCEVLDTLTNLCDGWIGDVVALIVDIVETWWSSGFISDGSYFLQWSSITLVSSSHRLSDAIHRWGTTVTTHRNRFNRQLLYSTKDLLVRDQSNPYVTIVGLI